MDPIWIVLIVLVAEGWRGARLRNGSLADVAPTICELLQLSSPASMTGRSLILG